MSLNETPRAARVHIAIFGNRNAGKSSIINAITGQEIAIVSDIKGTTTDPVYKAMELLPIGPVVVIDTAGLDDVGQLGELRKRKTMDVLNKTDIALVVVDVEKGITGYDIDIINAVKSKKLPLIIVINKIDKRSPVTQEIVSINKKYKAPVITVSATNRKGIERLKNAIIDVLPDKNEQVSIIGDLIRAEDFVVLVTPIDASAPKGRLILPQQQTIRDILDSNAIAIVTKEYQLKDTLKGLSKKPAIVVTDSQVFSKVDADTPSDIPMTSFSILFARYKGDLAELVKGVKAVKDLRDDDTVLISEACTHHRQDDDIGRVKIPRWITEKTGKEIRFEFSSGIQFTEEIKKYSLIVHCGGCMMNRTAMLYRIDKARQYGVPIVNYGVLISYVTGILERAIAPFPEVKKVWDEELY